MIFLKRPFDLRAGDIILLCSDGVDSIKGLSSIEATVTAQDNAESAANSLVETVKAVGRPRQDNTSVVVSMIGKGLAPTQIKNQIEEKSDRLHAVRRIILPGVTVTLAVMTLWFAVSSWRANTDLQAAHSQIEVISAENAALEDQLKLISQSTDQMTEVHATMSSISNVVTDNENVLKGLESLENKELSPELTNIIQFMAALISENQSLVAGPLRSELDDGLRDQVLADLLNTLNSDDVSENLAVLIPYIEEESLQNLVHLIFDLLRDSDAEAREAHQASDAIEQKLLLNWNAFLR